MVIALSLARSIAKLYGFAGSEIVQEVFPDRIQLRNRVRWIAHDLVHYSG